MSINEIYKENGKIHFKNLLLKPKTEIGDISCEYGLLPVILRKTKCELRGNLKGQVVLSLSKSNFNLLVNFDEIGKSSNLLIKGKSQLTGNIRTENKTVKSEILIDKLSIKVGAIPLNLKEVKIMSNLRGNVLRIDKIESQGVSKIFLQGQINLNYNHPEYSRINLNGKLHLGKITKDITVTGNFGNPKIIF